MVSADSIPVILATAALGVLLALMVGPTSDTDLNHVQPVCALSPVIDSLYASEVQSRIHSLGDFHYMDFTGSSLYTNRQLDDIRDLLAAGIFGNPHSKSSSSKLSTLHVDDVRHKLFEYFRADPEEYVIVFTRSATGALMLLGDAFPFAANSTYAYTVSNHNSVLGIRSYAQKHGARVSALSEEEVERWLSSEGDGALGGSQGTSSGEVALNLFAFPAKDNYAGVLYPLEWIDKVHDKGDDWLVLLDTAAYAPTYRIDLSDVKPDFLVVSFYKMFGLPSGVGCWIMKRSAEAKLRRTYWGGSSVFTATPGHDGKPWEVRFEGAAKWEDGTLPFLEIASLQAGFDALDRVGGIDAVSKYVACLGRYLSSKLQGLSHSNGRPLVHLYGKHYDDPSRQSSIANFQLVKPDGSYFSYRRAAAFLAENGFQMRDGCACNPGACYSATGVSEDEVRDKATRAHGDYQGWELISRNERLIPLGSLRASLGWLSRAADVDALVDFLAKSYIDRVEDVEHDQPPRSGHRGQTQANLYGC